MVNMIIGVKIEVEYISIVDLVLTSYHILKLVNIAYMPFISKNLVSISILNKCEHTFSLRNKKVIIYYDCYGWFYHVG